VQAQAACSGLCAHLADQLGWMAESGVPGNDRQLALDLRKPLEQLAARYPAPAKAAAAANPATSTNTAPAAPKGAPATTGTPAPAGESAKKDG
jgi:hypothetical protein